MKKKVYVIGSGFIGSIINEIINKLPENDVVFIQNPNEIEKFKPTEVETKSSPFINLYNEEDLIGNNKKFVCKGTKHQYENVDNKWVCQCGKQLY